MAHQHSPNRHGDRGPHLTPSARIASLRNIGHLARLIWASGPGLVISTLSVRLVQAVLPLPLLWVPKLILDAVVAWVTYKKGDLGLIWLLVGVELFLSALNEVLRRLNTLCDSLLADRFTNLVSIRLMRHASSLDLASFEDPSFYDKLARASTQTTGRLTLLVSLFDAGQEILTLAVLTIGVVAYAPWLLLFLVVAVIPAFVGETHFSKLKYSALFRWTPHRRRLDYLRSLGTDIQSAKEVKLFQLGDYLARMYEQVSSDIYSENKELARKQTVTGSALTLISTGAYYGAYAMVLREALAGVISIGTFTFLTGSFSRSRAVIGRLVNTFAGICEQAVLLDDLVAFFQRRPSISSSPNAVPAPRPIRQGFEFRNVSFAYPGSTRLVVRNISFHVGPTEKLALVGENGAGKTTIVKLLARLYDPTIGQILLDGIDLRQYDLDDLRKQISILFQDYMRYDMTVRHNIGFGNIDTCHDSALMRMAASKSLSDRLIDRFPGGYEQMLGRRFEGGIELSGGEWQRLALARAYMRDAQLVILDEPTATLDARAEYELFRHFVELMRGRMALLISHRFSTVRMADRILTLADGGIIEEGTHRELIARGGRYAELFEIQASGYR